MNEDIGMVKIEVSSRNIEKKIKKWWNNKMVQVFEKADLEEYIEKDVVFVVIPEKKIIVKKKEEQKHKKKHKKTIDITKVRRNLDTKMYSNRFVMR